MNNLVKRLPVFGLMLLMLAACRKETSTAVTKQEPTPQQPGTNNPPPPPPPNNTNQWDAVVETTKTIQKGITTNVNANIGGYLEALPSLYDSTSKRYPLILFIHGVGELGNGSTQLLNAASCGVPNVIKWNSFPANFVSNGKNFSFIVITPQFKAWPSTSDVNDMLNYTINKYRIDTTRIYLSGLSMGGGVTWEYDAVYPNRIAASVPICGASTPTDSKAQKIANGKLPVWAFHNEDDPTVTVNNSKGYVSKINGFNANPAAKLTLWPTGGHDSWTKATDPAYKENGINIYEWMLQYTRNN
jgi:predicted peptidase